MNIIALDLGTKTGWARWADGELTSGTVFLAHAKELRAAKELRLDRRQDMRVTRLWEWIAAHKNTPSIDWLFFEDVQFLSTQLQAQLWAGLRSAVWMHGRAGLQIDCVPVGTLKKFATGNGGATKEAMAAALGCRVTSTGIKSRPYRYIFEGHEIDDNEVDARHLLAFAMQKLGVKKQSDTALAGP